MSLMLLPVAIKSNTRTQLSASLVVTVCQLKIFIHQ